MDNQDFSQILHRGFCIAIGAVASLVETGRHPEKRAEALSDLQLEFNLKTREWAAKGETTEQEARRAIDSFLRQQNWGGNTADSSSQNGIEKIRQNDLEQDVNVGLQELRNELAELKDELAKMRSDGEVGN